MKEKTGGLSFWFCFFFIFLFALFFFFSFAHISLTAYESLSFPFAEDQAMFHQSFWNLTHNGSLAITTALNNYNNVFGMHFTPILFFLVPIYLLNQSPVSLILISIMSLALSGIFIFLSTHKLADNPWLAGAVVFLYFTYLPLTFLASQGFRYLIIGLFFLSGAVFFYLSKRFWPMFLFLILTCLCREDISLVVIGFSLLALFDKRSARWRYWPAILGLSYFILVVSWIMPNLNGTGGQGGLGFAAYSAFGDTPLKILISMVTNLPLLYQMLIMPHHFIFFSELFSPLYYLPLLSPCWVLLPFAYWLILLLSSVSAHANAQYWYVAPLLPFIFIALAAVLKKILVWGDRRWRLGTLGVSLILVLLMHSAYLGPGGRRLFNGFHARSNHQLERVQKLFDQIPRGASVMTQANYLPYLSSRRVIVLPRPDPATDYLVVDATDFWWPLPKPEIDKFRIEMIVSGRYKLLDELEGISLYKRQEGKE